MDLTQYSQIKVTVLRRTFKASEIIGYGHPEVGDLAWVIEVYQQPTLGYELECVDDYGLTKWMASVAPDDFEYEVIKRGYV